MRPLLLCTLTLVLMASPSSSQTAPTDSQTLQALLAEVRQLRHDLRSTTATGQRVQIALYRLERQNDVLLRATQRLSDVRSKLANVVSEKNQTLLQIQVTESTAKNSLNTEERSQLEDIALPSLKSRLEAIKKEEQQTRALNDILDRLNNALEEMSRK
jgi:hypothetical protein